MKIIETFDSLQGEGLLMGVPMSFIRTAGCNLRCAWCDTGYSFDPGKDMSIEDICKTASKKWVCITGGEPLLQPDLRDLVARLQDLGKKIEIETNGSVMTPEWVGVVESWSLDIKLPSSGNPSDRGIIEDWLLHLCNGDQVKLVIAREEDFRYAYEWIDWMRRLYVPPEDIIISPAAIKGAWAPGLLEATATFCIENNLRMSLQLHKIIWGDKRGV